MCGVHQRAGKLTVPGQMLVAPSKPKLRGPGLNEVFLFLTLFEPLFEVQGGENCQCFAVAAQTGNFLGDRYAAVTTEPVSGSGKHVF